MEMWPVRALPGFRVHAITGFSEIIEAVVGMGPNSSI